MILEQNNFHIDFQLNSTSFVSVDAILVYAKTLSPDIFHFLKDWFSDDSTLVVQTSGSTGVPKSILLKKELMKNSARATGNYFSLPSKTSALLCLPVHYIAGKMMLIRAITLGWHLDIVAPNSNPLENVEKAYGFSAMVPLQLENSLLKVHLIKKLIVGGGVVSNTLQEKLQHIKTEVFATYGMTETITHIAVKPLNNAKISPVFYEALPNVDLYIDDRNCLVIDAPKVSEEFIFTNDIVQLISTSQFKWLGRFDNVINSGGVKLHPEKIEEKLSKIVSTRFFVTGIADEKLGEKLVLIIEGVISREVEKSLFNDIKNLASLSKFEKPKEIYFTKQFIETKSGKIQRTQTLDKIFTN